MEKHLIKCGLVLNLNYRVDFRWIMNIQCTLYATHYFYIIGLFIWHLSTNNWHQMEFGIGVFFFFFFEEKSKTMDTFCSNKKKRKKKEIFHGRKKERNMGFTEEIVVRRDGPKVTLGRSQLGVMRFESPIFYAKWSNFLNSTFVPSK